MMELYRNIKFERDRPFKRKSFIVGSLPVGVERKGEKGWMT